MSFAALKFDRYAPWQIGAALAGIGLATLLGALAFEYLGGIRPCALCLEQRIPWAIVIMLAGAAMLTPQPGTPAAAKPATFALLALVLAYGVYLSGFHAGVEWKWWPGPAACSASTLSVDGDIFGDLSPSQIVRCDEIAWSLFGLSLAGYNFLISLGALGVALTGLAATWPRTAKVSP